LKKVPPKNNLTIWFTGLSASGKTTLSKILFEDLRASGINNIELLDGDLLREAMGNFDYDSSSREELGLKKAKLAQKLNSEGKIVIISGIAHKKKWRQQYRKLIKNYYEIFLNCDAKVCSSRDFKGNYQKAQIGEINNFIGVHEDYEISNSADLVINSDRLDVNSCSKEIFLNVSSLISSYEY